MTEEMLEGVETTYDSFDEMETESDDASEPSSRKRKNLDKEWLEKLEQLKE